MADYDLADWRARVRAALSDLVVPYLWTDDQIDQCTMIGITDHSLLLPHLVRQAADTILGAVTFTLTVSSPAADLLGVVGVELAGKPIPARQVTSTAASRADASRAVRSDGKPQSYLLVDRTLRFNQALIPADVGTNVLVVWQLETYVLPDAAALYVWNGPPSDVPLVLMLAKRAAYQLLAELQARSQGITTPTIASGSSNVHIDIPPILVALETEIKRALDLRAARVGSVPPLPSGR